MKKLLAILALWLLPLLAFGQGSPGNFSAVLLPSAARTTTPVNSPYMQNIIFHGAHVVVNVTAFTAGTYTAHVQGKDVLSGNYYDICVGTAIGSVSTNIIKVFPGITASANVACGDILPRVWRVQLIGATGQSMTFSVSASLMQ